MRSRAISIAMMLAVALTCHGEDQSNQQKDWVLGAIVEAPTYSFYIGDPNLNGTAYVPNFSTRIGPSIEYKRISLKATTGLPIPRREVERRGESEQRNFILSSYFNDMAFDIYYLYFRGFYVGRALSELQGRRPARYTQLPEAKSLSIGINFYYNVDANGFRLNAAFDRSEFKIEDGVAWVFIPFYQHWKIDLGRTIIPGSDSTGNESIPNLTGGNFDTLGASLAYSRTWTKNHFFFSIMGGVGPGLQYQTLSGTGAHDKIDVAAKLNAMGSLGYQREDIRTGLKLLVDTLFSRVQDEKVYSSSVGAEFYFSYRL